MQNSLMSKYWQVELAEQAQTEQVIAVVAAERVDMHERFLI
jgi:hypothetical protein